MALPKFEIDPRDVAPQASEGEPAAQTPEQQLDELRKYAGQVVAGKYTLDPPPTYTHGYLDLSPRHTRP